jgi:hypothetical protein
MAKRTASVPSSRGRIGLDRRAILFARSYMQFGNTGSEIAKPQLSRTACTEVHSFPGLGRLFPPQWSATRGDRWALKMLVPSPSHSLGQRQWIALTSRDSWQASPYPW